MLQASSDVNPAMTETVVATMKKVDDEPALQVEVDALVNYIQHKVLMRNVMKQRLQWDEDHQTKVNAAIATAMKEWDEEHYPSLLEETWGWHPFYFSIVTNPICPSSRPAYPLNHSVVEAINVQFQILEQEHVQRVHPVPWSVLFLRCFLKFHSLVDPIISHPFSGGTIGNVTAWLKMAEEDAGDGWRAWHLGTRYLKEEGFLVFAGARQVESKQQWLAELDVAWSELKNPTPAWWEELHFWRHSTQFRAAQDMAFHDKSAWLKAWTIRDRPVALAKPLACYDRWLQHREDLDIGYVLASPGKLPYPRNMLPNCVLRTT
jgi:hypothetical protein